MLPNHNVLETDDLSNTETIGKTTTPLLIGLNSTFSRVGCIKLNASYLLFPLCLDLSLIFICGSGHFPIGFARWTMA